MFELFVDTADIEQIKKINKLGIIDGVTTNPSLFKSSASSSYVSLIDQISKEISGPISAEVMSTSFDEMIKEALILSDVAPNVVIKVPMTSDGIAACSYLRKQGKDVNVTLCFSPCQAVVAAKANATYVSPFIGRIDDGGSDGLSLIESISGIYSSIGASTKILAASIRSTVHCLNLFHLNVDAITAPPSVIYNLLNHNLTKQGLEKFSQDWKNTDQSF